jgi:hypothetical protein
MMKQAERIWDCGRTSTEFWGSIDSYMKLWGGKCPVALMTGERVTHNESLVASRQSASQPISICLLAQAERRPNQTRERLKREKALEKKDFRHPL